jgi:oligopeptide transport system substrate-binding protein
VHSDPCFEGSKRPRCAAHSAHPVHLLAARSWLTTLALLGILTLATACNTSGPNTPNSGASRQPSRQILLLPNVGAQDLYYLDPAQEPNANDPNQGPDPNSALALSMLYSGLVRTDQHLNIIPDQATWDISPDGRVYTFHLKNNLRFSDGTLITAQTYVYSLTRALLPEVKSPLGPVLEKPILGAAAVSSGKARTLAGVQAPDPQTLRITLTAPTPYFLASLSNELFFPVNQQLIQRYGQSGWTDHAVGNAIGSGPFMIKSWEHNVKMILVPNPYYYGPRPRLSEIDMIFVADPATAFQEYRAGQFNLIWNIPQSDLAAARGIAGFLSVPLQETDMLFFNTRMPPFDNPIVRQAFSYAIDRATLVHSCFKDSVIVAATLIPPGIPDYQSDYQGLTFDAQRALQLLRLVYPDPSLAPPITFSFPPALISPSEARLLASMWSSTLKVSIKLLPTELNAYDDELTAHQIQLGFAQWYALYPDPHNWLAPNLLSNAPHNNGQWQNQQFDQLIEQADHSQGDERMVLYQQAEQLALDDGALLPLDHETISAIIPPWVHGITLNAYGLYVADWSQVYLSPH